MSRRGSPRPFIGSLVVHGLLAACLALTWKKTSEEALIPAMRRADPIQVRLRSGPPTTGSSSLSHAHAQGHHGISKPRRLELGLSPRSSNATTGEGEDSGRDSGRGGSDGYAEANAMGMQEESRLYPFFTALWKKIDSVTGYPDDFVRERIKGYVTAQLVVDKRGVFTGKIVRVNSDEPLLQTYVMVLLFHALSEPLPPALWAARDETILVARFTFQTFTYGEIPPDRRLMSLKNVLEFERHGYTDPKLKQTIERFMTHYMPPIIPVPGGFYIDFIRAYQLIRNIGNHKMEEDDLRLERIELDREQWQNVIKKDSSGRS